MRFNADSPSMKNTEKFYSEIRGFSKFEALSEDHLYHAVPSDWYVVITDIEGSTKAIQAGRYRDVNMLGAASVAVIQKHFGADPFPFIFGGDGATFLIPPTKIEAVRHSLSILKAYSVSQFDLGLRVGIMKVAQIYKAEHKLEVAKFEIAHGKCTAFIRGGGITWAESQIKKDKLNLCIEANKDGDLGDLSGLSCRWQPLQSRHGKILSILIQPRVSDTNLNSLLDRILKKFVGILGGATDLASPISQSNMKYKGFWACLKAEWKVNPNKFSIEFIQRFLEIALCIWTFRWGFKEFFPASKYQSEIPNHSDYRKFDDTLRFVLDCTQEQAVEIRDYLDEVYHTGEIFYGIHESSHALMTCFVENIKPGGHIHFIDGFDGGYALAAKQMKSQIGALNSQDKAAS